MIDNQILTDLGSGLAELELPFWLTSLSMVDFHFFHASRICVGLTFTVLSSVQFFLRFWHLWFGFVLIRLFKEKSDFFFCHLKKSVYSKTTITVTPQLWTFVFEILLYALFFNFMFVL